MPDHARTSRVTRAALLAAAVVGPLLAAPAARAQQPAASDWRARLLRAARATTFGAERAPIPDATVPRGASTAGLPDVTYAAAVGRRGEVGVAGRITSRAAYPRLGIPAGVSYLWIDTRAPVRMAIVPADASRPAYWLSTSPHATTTPSGTGSGSGTTADEPCRMSPFGSRLSTRRPAGGTRLLMGACTCVDGVWMHSEGYGAELTAATARALLPR